MPVDAPEPDRRAQTAAGAAARADPRVLLLGGDVTWNQGDRAIRAALLALLRQQYPAAEVWTLSKTPARDRAHFGVEILGRSPFALMAVPFRRRFDGVIWGGGQLLQDDSSKLKNPFWAVMLNYLHAVAGLPILGCGLGIGPLTTAWGRFFARHALRPLDALIVREQSSLQNAAGLLDGHPEIVLGPDLATMLAPAPADQARDFLANAEGVPAEAGELIVGVVIRRWFQLRGNVLPYDWSARSGLRPDPGSARFECFKVNLAEALNRFAAGRRIRYLFFPLSRAPWDRDDAVADDVVARLRAPAQVLRLECPPAMLKALLGQCALVVSGRMHGALLAMGMHRPTIGLSYSRKVDDLFGRLGQAERRLTVEAVADAQGADRLLERLEAVSRDRAAIEADLAARWPELTRGMACYRQAFGRLADNRARRT